MKCLGGSAASEPLVCSNEIALRKSEQEPAERLVLLFREKAGLPPEPTAIEPEPHLFDPTRNLPQVGRMGTKAARLKTAARPPGRTRLKLRPRRRGDYARKRYL